MPVLTPGTPWIRPYPGPIMLLWDLYHWSWAPLPGATATAPQPQDRPAPELPVSLPGTRWKFLEVTLPEPPEWLIPTWQGICAVTLQLRDPRVLGMSFCEPQFSHISTLALKKLHECLVSQWMNHSPSTEAMSCNLARRVHWRHHALIQITFSHFLSSKLSAYSLERKLRLHIKKQRHYFVSKSPSSQGYGFSSSHVWMWELDYKESWAPKNWCFWTVVLENTLESPLDCAEIQPVCPKDQSWILIGRTDVEAEAPILWPPDAKSWFIWKDPGAGKDWRREEEGTTEDETVGWHHRFNGHEFG